MSTFKFTDYKVDAGTDGYGRSWVWIICPHCPGTQSRFADYERAVAVGDLLTIAWDHHTERHREPHLIGDNE